MPPSLHPAVAGFDRMAERYERGRPPYPTEAIHHLTEGLGIRPGATVIDLGAGTGKLTRALVPTGARLVGIEPVRGMRRAFRTQLPLVPLVAGVAEALPLRDGSADHVVAAQSFHWFGPGAVAELARVLRPSGGLGLVWNRRDESVPWMARLDRIIDAEARGIPRTRSEAWKAGFDSSDRFEPLTKTVFRFSQSADVPTVVDRVLSISAIGLLPEPRRAEIAGQVRALAAEQPSTGGRVRIPYRTELYLTHKVT